MLYIVGLGAGNLDLLPLKTYRILKQAEHVYLRTEVHPAAKDLEKEEIKFISFDYLYESADDFEQIYQEIAREITKFRDKDIVYAVPGHPVVAETSVQEIINKLEKDEYQLVPAVSFLGNIFARLNSDPIKGIKVVDGLNFTDKDLDPTVDTIISQVYNQAVASEVKLTLMEVYPDEFQIKVLRGVGLQDERIKEIPLYKLDRLNWIDHLTSIYLPADKNISTNFNRLVEIMEILRSEEGCPWDKKQNHYTLKKHLIEETYEVIERIDKGDYFGLAEELGDLLLQIIFHSQIAKEEGRFTIRNVISKIITKLIRRHPHVFGDLKIEDEREVMANWEEIKQTEKGKDNNSLMEEVPIQLPALLQAQEIQDKAAQIGFDWENYKGVLAKIEEELQEFKQEIENNNLAEGKKEFGDLLFSLVNLARFLDIDAETSLLETIKKFKTRFQYMEDKLVQSRSSNELSLQELDVLWEEAKENLGQEGK